MKPQIYFSRHWWQLPLLLLMCFIGGVSSARAGARFDAGGTWISHQPTINQQWITLRVMFYDPNDKDGFFLHDQAESGHDGPALYINGEWICSPDWQLAWPGSGSGSSDYVEKQRSVDEWWGNTNCMSYTKAAKDRNYLVKFWNPAKSNEGQYTVYMCIYPDKLHVGETFKVKIRGKWKINNTSTDWEQVELTTNKITSPYSGSPSAVMGDYNHMLISGSLNSSHGPTTVGTTANATWGSLTMVNPDALDSRSNPAYSQGTASFSNLSLTFDRTSFWDSESKPVEFVIEEKVNIGPIIADNSHTFQESIVIADLFIMPAIDFFELIF